MEIDKTKIRTQDGIDEPAPIDQVEERVEAEMKVIEARRRNKSLTDSRTRNWSVRRNVSRKRVNVT